MIAAKVANARALDYPRSLEVIVAVDGGDDGDRGRAPRAPDTVLELPRGGKIRAQDAAVQAARGEVIAFSDANAHVGAGRAARRSCAPFADPQVGYACGQVAFTNEAGTNQEGLYWRYEMLLRAQESALASGHRRQRRDLRGAPRGVRSRSTRSWATTSRSRSRWSRPGCRAVYVPEARATREDGARRSRASGRASGG